MPHAWVREMRQQTSSPALGAGSEAAKQLLFFPSGSDICPPPYDAREGEAPAGREERWDAGSGYTAWWGSAISPVLLCLVIWRKGRLKKKKPTKDGREVGSPAQPKTQHPAGGAGMCPQPS